MWFHISTTIMRGACRQNELSLVVVHVGTEAQVERSIRTENADTGRDDLMFAAQTTHRYPRSMYAERDQETKSAGNLSFELVECIVSRRATPVVIGSQAERANQGTRRPLPRPSNGPRHGIHMIDALLYRQLCTVPGMYIHVFVGLLSSGVGNMVSDQYRETFFPRRRSSSRIILCCDRSGLGKNPGDRG